MTNTMITSEVDLARRGKQTGFIPVPHATDRSAYGRVPVTVLPPGAGPRLLKTAGIHSDECERQIALNRLAMTERGLRRILHRLGMLPGYRPDTAGGTSVTRARAEGPVCTVCTGLFEPFKDIGDETREGEEVRVLHWIVETALMPIPAESPYSGFVLCKRTPGPIEPEDAVFQIVRDVPSV